MNTADLKFNIIYTPGMVRYLSPFVKSMLDWCDCSLRLISNGCSEDEVKQLQRICDYFDRLELLVMPQQEMIPHGDMLEYMQTLDESDYYCFMDSDVIATGPFMDDFRDDLNTSEVFSSGLPLWGVEKDFRIPPYFKSLHGIHAHSGDMTVACDYFVIYNNKAFQETLDATGMGMKLIGWDNIPPDQQKMLQDLGQEFGDYDTGKVFTLLMAARGARIKFRESKMLKHIGGFATVGEHKGKMLHSRNRLDQLAYHSPRFLGRFIIRLADIWSARKQSTDYHTRRENINLASRNRKRIITARYFYLLLVGLMDDKPTPEPPLLGDAGAERRVREVSEDLRRLAIQVRTEPGPWQDQ
ncbi:MAG: hypothetical protein ACR2QG_12805 [Gammaproteobacteria bacterium]